jgi:hypothetical protein
MTPAEHATQFERFVQEVQHRTAVQKSLGGTFQMVAGARFCAHLDVRLG